MSRTSRVKRTTKESSVLVELNLDGTGEISVDTGVPFFDHMLSQLGKHSGFNLTVKTTGDVDVDSKIQGLIHISEFGSEVKMKEKLELNKEYEFQILSFQPQRHWMSLRLK